MTDLFSQLMETPLAILDNSYDKVFRLTTEQINAFQKHWVCKRFTDLRPNIPFLDKLATEQGVDKVRDIDDITPLLFAHTVYKSYPMSYLEKSRFDRLTKWLSGLTTTDLSHIDASKVECIDDWLDLMDKETTLMIVHTSGTTGKLSFLPRTKQQMRLWVALVSNILRDWHGANSRPDMLKTHRPVINPGYRHGAATAQRWAALQVEMYAGGEDNTLFLYPDRRLSADMISLAGRLRVAEARGEQGALSIPPALLRRRGELIELEKQRPEALRRFFEAASTRFANQDIYAGGHHSLMYDWAVEGLQQGQKHIFGPNTFLLLGGGMKGRAFPEGWRQTIQDYFGFPSFSETYAMTEAMGLGILCEAGKYHMPPIMVLYLLDPKTGKLLPRKDNTTGRLAFMDLLADNYWAGMITGDEVTMGGWDQPCKCGRSGCYINSTIRRYSEKEGGDDKVTCAGAPEAHDRAVAFLTEAS